MRISDWSSDVCSSDLRVISSSRPEEWTGMKTTRKRYSAEFKAKVAMEAIRGELTLAELAVKHGIHHTMIGAWKRQAMEGMASLFDGGDQTRSEEHTSELQSLMRISYAVFCLKKKKKPTR